ncbi:uncharacterized protein BDZ99DRAFT_577584 [Mytilinidion resinicola]|uniref:Uncharacterized protein n=1 Tax=Mytilinidion resinicola TaxID=574789 RepID=A0A6A6XYU0_9PEZI|nr:uncharacterized protein BDZ99DRAFT_577584 [Mytilinidion resinicola]KAF2801448.1 hypothetical protein BDZ99DRAFT_577584 [Mytilinidion resinicola]
MAFVVGDFMWLLTEKLPRLIAAAVPFSHRRRRPVSHRRRRPVPSLIAAAVRLIAAAVPRLIAAAVPRLIAAAAVPLSMTREATFVRWCRGSREL